MPFALTAYLFLCLSAGWLGRNRAIGFSGFFFLSIVLTPFVMLLAYFLGAPRDESTT